ncbi:MAG TPA: diguanylate cyclase, partial [Gemmatimonadaceae bacterium]|nr:diguanylate cyclase [Gemmatimonadaceae bacterium]
MQSLIADDEIISRKVLHGTLVQLGHDCVAVADGSSAIEALLGTDGPRLAILDWMMPGTDGLEVCRVVRERAEAYVYIILLTGRDSAEDMITALDSGVDDFLTKPFRLGELRARLRSGTRVLELQSGLLDAQEALRHHATLDHLTGLWNRRMILEQLDRELSRVLREKCSLTVAMVDIDRFKAINDTHGHAAGDAVIRDTAAAIRSQLRDYDVVGRYGGEEFLLLLPGCGPESGRMIADRVRERIEAVPTLYGALTLSVTASFGLASTKVAGMEPSSLIKAADSALYRAKSNGRNRVEESLPGKRERSATQS